MDVESSDEIRVDMEETTAEVAAPSPKPAVKETRPPAVHLHHGLIGIGLVAAGVTFAIVAPVVRPLPRLVVGSSLAIAGAALILDDYIAHQESNCGVDTWFNFMPCPEMVVKKDEGQG